MNREPNITNHEADRSPSRWFFCSCDGLLNGPAVCARCGEIAQEYVRVEDLMSPSVLMAAAEAWEGNDALPMQSEWSVAVAMRTAIERAQR